VRDVRARARVVVAALDEQPLRLGARPRALQSEPALQLLAVQDEDRVAALERLRPSDPAALLVGPAIPDDHPAIADPALERVVRHAVIADLDRHPLDRGVQARPLRHRPRAHDPADLQAQVEVVRGGRVLLHDEDAGAHPADRELLMALGLDALAGDRAALLQERRQLVDRGCGALGMHLQRVLLAVAHPPEHAQVAGPAHDLFAQAGALGADDRADRDAHRHRV
jgi:hypothetical protein